MELDTPREESLAERLEKFNDKFGVPDGNRIALGQFIVADVDLEMIGFCQKVGDYPNLAANSSCGISPAYSAVLNDRPEVLRFLHLKRVNLNACCDAVGFGTPAFYCAYYGRVECLRVLAQIGINLEDGRCNKFGEKVEKFIKKYQPEVVQEEMLRIVVSRKNDSAAKIQRWSRDRQAVHEAREYVGKVRSGEVQLWPEEPPADEQPPAEAQGGDAEVKQPDGEANN